MKIDRPNILFILSDQHASNVLGCYGDKIVRTPNIDQLSSEGITFDFPLISKGGSFDF